MIEAQGVYIGEVCTGSNYSNNGFCDFVFSTDELKDINIEIYTVNDGSFHIENAKSTSKNKALNYYSKYLRGTKGNGKRACDIICSSSSVDMLFYQENELGEPQQIFAKSIEVLKEDGEEFEAIKRIGENFGYKYPEALEIKELRQLIDDYEIAVLHEEEVQMPETLKKMIESVRINVINRREKFLVVYKGYELELSYEVYLRQVIDEIVDNYINAINKLISQNSNTLVENETIMIYMGRYGEGTNVLDKLGQVGKKNHVEVQVINDIEKSIARGNAYYCFLTKALLKDTVEKNLSRYQFCYYDESYVLSKRKDVFSLKVVNDFENAIYIKINDTVMEKSKEYMFNCPFIRKGDELLVMYEYTPSGLFMEITYKDLEEKQELKIKY